MQTFKQFIQEQGTVGGPMGINASGQLGASPMAPPKMQTKSVPPGPISLGTKNTKPAAGKTEKRSSGEKPSSTAPASSFEQKDFDDPQEAADAAVAAVRAKYNLEGDTL